MRLDVGFEVQGLGHHARVAYAEVVAMSFAHVAGCLMRAIGKRSHARMRGPCILLVGGMGSLS